ncbi:MAG: flagellar motor switch protein FliN [Firmicutes bacterium ZCTH02-B6]|nr:MAG: flagellar motor switch protein FliN [Firmicutes bacterium ZCTH02-B6]
MSDHLLSQEEIDALLKGASAAPEEPAGDEPDVLAELYQRALVRLAPLLPSLAGKALRNPAVEGRWSTWGEVRQRLSSPLVARCDFAGAVQGMQVSLVDGAVRAVLPALAPAEEPVSFLNKLSLALVTALEQELGTTLAPKSNAFQEVDLSQPQYIPFREDEACVALQLRLRGEVGELVWLEVLPGDVAKEMAARAGVAAAGVPMGPQAAPAAHTPQAQTPTTGTVPVTPAQFAPLRPQTMAPQPANIGLILDVPLQVTVELGRRRMLIREVLELGKGSLIELDKLAGEPVDVFVNGKLIAKGEVVVIDENFGVKVTSIVSPAERVQNLQ